jgi:lipid-A-disaccharide synthase
VHVDNISLPNILLGERFQTELLQEEATPEATAEAMLQLYPGETHREQVCASLKEACAKLGEPGAAYRVAEKVLACARRHID